ncbi:DUF2332 family protein [Aciditerrimonas ferrireducens]|uniref:DUF2332 family protein n=1 Tax=Aciditerrimonas ferrireducens TaxID=667306 RepID=UPI00289B07A1|nr:DUF2332 family protein [Aciditerrimonas ferrireducens]
MGVQVPPPTPTPCSTIRGALRATRSAPGSPDRSAAGRSVRDESLAMAVADDEAILDFLTSLPAEKRQPNLFFAAARSVLDDVPGLADLRRLVTERHDHLAEVMVSRRTQTNEPARCATFLPVLSRLPGSSVGCRRLRRTTGSCSSKTSGTVGRTPRPSQSRFEGSLIPRRHRDRP